QHVNGIALGMASLDQHTLRPHSLDAPGSVFHLCNRMDRATRNFFRLRASGLFEKLFKFTY
ncbi:MAG: hypothetical protein Q3X60_09130, partial [Alistipes sp.]